MNKNNRAVALRATQGFWKSIKYMSKKTDEIFFRV